MCLNKGCKLFIKKKKPVTKAELLLHHFGVKEKSICTYICTEKDLQR